jgi:hypothetical protein
MIVKYRYKSDENIIRGLKEKNKKAPGVRGLFF